MAALLELFTGNTQDIKTSSSSSPPVFFFAQTKRLISSRCRSAGPREASLTASNYFYTQPELINETRNEPQLKPSAVIAVSTCVAHLTLHLRRR